MKSSEERAMRLSFLRFDNQVISAVNTATLVTHELMAGEVAQMVRRVNLVMDRISLRIPLQCFA